MRDRHDQSYKLLFSEPRVIRDLLTGFVEGEWVERLDLDSLEKVSGSFVTDDLRDREGDVIWRVRSGDDWLYLYLLIEFQSSVDPFMALRIMTYVGLLYQDLVKQRKLASERRLPPVLPIVLYNGERRWSAAKELSELIHPAATELARYQPSQSYLLLDEGAIVADERWPTDTRNLVAAIFRLEYHHSQQDVIDTIGQLVEWLKSPGQARLRRHFATWIKRVLLPNWVPGGKSDHEQWQALNDLEEVHTMLSERAKRWPEQWKQKGLEEGRRLGREIGLEEGREEGRLETARNLLARTAMDDREIAEICELELEQVAELRRQA
ncbi:transposase [Halomonas sp. YLB-10]|uniref:Rpn family recombination-promoting nuclease/putative transposase n=1 Tax=Halomonas sp. YLB-10 TaxID=2483111 RepID=UPI000F5F6442|nr:Rpn family recombination-promoting nuclease/putative transposase [Halomonas sp. YLB-10]RQW68949.1 transposase [Halomonas sp. YLB-10]